MVRHVARQPVVSPGPPLHAVRDMVWASKEKVRDRRWAVRCSTFASREAWMRATNPGTKTESVWRRAYSSIAHPSLFYLRIYNTTCATQAYHASTRMCKVVRRATCIYHPLAHDAIVGRLRFMSAIADCIATGQTGVRRKSTSSKRVYPTPRPFPIYALVPYIPEAHQASQALSVPVFGTTSIRANDRPFAV
jgi:hypothetical protein